MYVFQNKCLSTAENNSTNGPVKEYPDTTSPYCPKTVQTGFLKEKAKIKFCYATYNRLTQLCENPQLYILYLITSIKT